MKRELPVRWVMLLSLAMIVLSGCEEPAEGAEGLPAPAVDLPAPEDDEMQAAVFAGGCFWCVEAVFEQLAGVRDVVSGYAGGTAETARYELVAAGRTDHAEVVRVEYDPSQISYGQLLHVFFATHDPTQLNRQGPDVGRQYRSAVFYATDEQKQVAEAYIRQLDEAGAFARPIVTALEPLEAFYPAEEYHQDYARDNPDDPYVRRWALPKIEKVREQFGELVNER